MMWFFRNGTGDLSFPHREKVVGFLSWMELRMGVQYGFIPEDIVPVFTLHGQDFWASVIITAAQEVDW